MRNEFDSVDYYFRTRLKEALDNKCLTGKDLEDCGVVAQSSIHEYIDCGRLPNLRTACRLAEFLDVSLDWLCGFDEGIKWSDALLPAQRKAPWVD